MSLRGESLNTQSLLSDLFMEELLVQVKNMVEHLSHIDQYLGTSLHTQLAQLVLVVAIRLVVVVRLPPQVS